MNVIPSSLVPVRPESQVSPDSTTTPDPSIPAVLVVKSDGSINIASDMINSQTNPSRLVLMSTADGNTNLYMIPKEVSSAQTAFLIKPIDGNKWNVDQSKFRPDLTSAAITFRGASHQIASAKMPTSFSVPSTLPLSTAAKSSVGGSQFISNTPSFVQGDLPSPTILSSALRQKSVHVRTPVFVTESVSGNSVYLRPSYIPVQSPIFAGTSTVSSSCPPVVVISQGTTSVSSVAVSTTQTMTSSFRVMQAVGAQTPLYVNNIASAVRKNSTGTANSQGFKPGSVVTENTVAPAKIANANPLLNLSTGMYIINGRPYLLSSGSSAGQATLIPVVVTSVGSSVTQTQVTAVSSSVNQTRVSVVSSLVNRTQTSAISLSVNQTPIYAISPSVNQSAIFAMDSSVNKSKVYAVKPSAKQTPGLAVRSTVNHDQVFTVNPSFNQTASSAVRSSVNQTQVYSVSPSVKQTQIRAIKRSTQQNTETWSSTSDHNGYYSKKVFNYTNVVATTKGSDYTEIICNKPKQITAVASTRANSTPPSTQTIASRPCLSPRNAALEQPWTNSPHFTGIRTSVRQNTSTLNTVSTTSSSKLLAAPLQLQPRPQSDSPQSISSEENDDSLPSVPSSSSTEDDSVRPMLLFRHDIARKLKPAVLQQSRDSEQTGAFSILPSSTTSSRSISSTDLIMSSVILTSSSELKSVPSSIQSMPGSTDKPTMFFGKEVSHAQGLSLNQTRPSIYKVNTIQKETAGRNAAVFNPSVPLTSSTISSTTSSIGTASQTLQHLTSISAKGKDVNKAINPAVLTLLARNSVYNTVKLSKGRSNFQSERENYSNESLSNYEDMPVAVNSGISELSCPKTNDDENSSSSNLKISSVFSLNPFVQESDNTNTDNLNLDNGKDGTKKDISDLDFSSSPSRNTRQRTKESTKASVSLLTQKGSEGTIVCLFPENLRHTEQTNKQTHTKLKIVNKRCRVVLRRLNMKKFKTPYSFKAILKELSKIKCSRQCRELVVDTFFSRAIKNRTRKFSRHAKQFIPCTSVSVIPTSSVTQNATEMNQVTSSTFKNGYCELLDKTMDVVSTNDKNSESVSAPSGKRLPKPDMPTRLNYKGQSISRPLLQSNPQTLYKRAENKFNSTATVSMPLSSASVKTHCSPDGSKYYSYTVRGKIILVPTSSFQTAFDQACHNTAMTVLDTSTSSSASVTQQTKPPVITSAVFDNAVSAFLSLPSNELTTGVSDSGTQGIKSEPITPGCSKTLEGPLSKVEVKPEPLGCGYSDEVNVCQTFETDINRKRRISPDLSDQHSAETVVEAEQQVTGTDAMRPFSISETPHSEKIRRLKEQLKQKEEALEEIRTKRYPTTGANEESGS